MTVATRALRASTRRRPLLAALAAVFCVDALTALVVLAYGNAYLLRTLEAPPSAPAVALTTFGLVKLIAAPLAGRVVDATRGRTVLVLTGGIELLALVVIIATRSEPGYLVGVGGLAAGIAASWILVFRALGAASDAGERGAIASSMSVVSAVATGLGFGLAAGIAEGGPWWLPFALGIAFALGAVALLRGSTARPAPAAAAVDAAPEAGAPAPADARVTVNVDDQPPGSGARLAAAAIVFGHFCIVTGLLVVFWPFTLDLLGLSPLRAMLVLLPAGVTGGAALVLSGRRSRPGRRLPQAAVLYALGATGLVATAVATNAPWFAAAAVLVAPALAGAQPVLVASMIDISRVAGRAGTALGWIFSAEALGAIVGPAAVGIAIELGDVRTGVLTIAAGTAALAVLAATASRRARL